MKYKEKKLIKQIRNNDPCTVTPQDIYDNTNFFKEQEPKPKQPFKLAFISSIIILFISFTLITLLSVQNHKLKNKEPEIVYVDKEIKVIDDTQGMSEEEKFKITENLVYFYPYAVSSFVHEEKVIFYLYYGYNLNEDGTKSYYYYYAFSLDKYLAKAVILSFNNTTLEVNLDNKSGLLTTINESETDDFTIRFTVSTESRTVEYVLNNCDF